MRADAQLLGVAVRSVGQGTGWARKMEAWLQLRRLRRGDSIRCHTVPLPNPTHAQRTCSPLGSAWHTIPAHLPWLLPLAACPAAAAAEAAAAPPAAYGEAHRRRRLCRAAAATVADAAAAVLHLSLPAGWRSRLGQPHCRQTAAASRPGIGRKLPPPPAARRRCWARQIVARRRTTRMLLTPARLPAAAGRAAGRGAVPAVGGGRDQALPRWLVAWRH